MRQNCPMGTFWKVMLCLWLSALSLPGYLLIRDCLSGRTAGCWSTSSCSLSPIRSFSAAGDCISFEPQPLAKVGVYAVRQNPILLHNLLSALNDGTLQEFVPQKSFLLALNMGNGTAVVRWHSLVWSGTTGFALKNYIDRKFYGGVPSLRRG